MVPKESKGQWYLLALDTGGFMFQHFASSRPYRWKTILMFDVQRSKYVTSGVTHLNDGVEIRVTLQSVRAHFNTMYVLSIVGPATLGFYYF